MIRFSCTLIVACGLSAIAFGQSKASLLAGHAFADDCQEGLDSFGENLYPILTEDGSCKSCHGGLGPGPNHSTPDMEASYNAIKTYVDFENVDSSVLLFRAGNGHGGCTICDRSMEDRIRTAVNSWWGQGENQCMSIGNAFTEEIAVPDDLPSEGEGYAALRFSLEEIDSDFSGHFLEIEAQRFSTPSEALPGSYRFRKPRIVGKDGTFHIKELRVLVNRKYDVLANNYTYIDATVSPQDVDMEMIPYPVMSTGSMIVLQDLDEGDKLSLSFDVIEKADPMACAAEDMFADQVMLTVNARQCFACHGGGENSAEGFAPANQVFNMDLDQSALCQAFIQRISFGSPFPSAAIAYPLLGTNGHPRIFTSADEVYPYWNPWLEQEAPAL